MSDPQLRALPPVGALLEHGHVDGRNRTYAGTRGNAAVPVLEFGDAALERVDGRIAQPRVDEARRGPGEAIRAAEILGADLAYVGTPFIVAEESLAAAGYRGMVIEATLDDLVLTPALTGANAYYLRQSIERAGLDPGNLVGKSSVDWRDSQRQLKAWRDIWSAGQGVGTIHASEPPARIVARLLDGYRQASKA